MKFDCLVCAEDFEAEQGSARLTCSEECRKTYAEFRQKLRETKPEEREQLVEPFLAKIEAKLGVDQFGKYPTGN